MTDEGSIAGPAADQQRLAAKVLARRRAVAIIDLVALRANYRQLAALSLPGDGAPVVKGSGYGLGMAAVSKAVAAVGARTFLVARREDGEDLRVALPAAEIMVLDGLGGHHPDEFDAHGLTPVLGDLADLKRWFVKPRRMPALVHFDTGMSRLGLRPDEAEAALAFLAPAPKSAIAGYMTHFLNADDADLARCTQQVADFHRAIAGLPKARTSIVNSAGLFLDSERAWRGSFTRLGKALYGIHTGPLYQPNPMRPVLSVYAPVLQVRDVAKGETIGYGATFTAPVPMRVATLGIGYTNGYLRSLSNKGVVCLDGVRAPVVGRVSMDLLTVDITQVPEAAVCTGAAEILGPNIGLTELSALAGSNEHEMQITLGSSCHRVYVGE